MERRLYESALEGDEVALLELLQEDALILAKAVASVETPLHIVAIRGYVIFSKEILDRKPELAGELDFQRRSPLHWASVIGHVETVKLLLLYNSNVCLIRDMDGKTPLHLVAMKDRVEVLNELVRAKPEACSIGDYRGETVLHLCITHSSFKALKLLVDSVNDDEFVNLKDGDGNSLLHLAVVNKKLEMLKFLLEYTKIKVNTLNVYGFTALDVLSQSPRDVKDMDILETLQQAGAVKAKYGSLRKNTTNDQISAEPSHSKGNLGKVDSEKKNNELRKKYNTLMVVASLIATMAFQAGVNPPGGFRQDTELPDHKVGFSIMATNYQRAYNQFLVSDTLGFVAPLSIILLLISGLPLKHRFFVGVLMVTMWIVITSMAFTYLVYVSTFATDEPTFANGKQLNSTISDDQVSIVNNILVVPIFSWISLLCLLILGHTIRLTVRLFRKFGRFNLSMIWSFNSGMNRNCINV